MGVLGFQRTPSKITISWIDTGRALLVRLSRQVHITTCAVLLVSAYSNSVFAIVNLVYEFLPAAKRDGHAEL